MPGLFAPGPKNYASPLFIPFVVVGVVVAYYGMAKMHPANPLVVLGGIVTVIMGAFLDLGKRDGSPKAKLGIVLFLIAGVLFAISDPTRTAHIVMDIGKAISNFGDSHFK